MNISAELAKKIWKDDPDMLEMIRGWDHVRCISKLDDNGIMTLYPMSVEGNGSPGIASLGSIDATPIGKPAKIKLLI